MPTDLEVKESTARLARWIRESNELMEGMHGPPGAKAALACSSLQLTQEHAQAIRVLLELPLQASSLALLRPQVESLTRGIWLSQCATEEWCLRFAEGEGGAEFSTKKMFEDINASDPYKDGAFEGFCSKVKTTLHDFTHGGARQIMGRIAEGGDGIGYLSDNLSLFWCSEVACHMDFMAKAETARVIGNVVLLRELFNLAKADPFNAAFAGN